MNTSPSAEGSRPRTRFLTAAVAWTALVAVALAVMPLPFRDRLPSPMATHWGPSGDPDGAMSLTALIVFALALWLAVAALCLAAASRGRALTRRSARAWLVAGLVWGAAFSLGLEAVTVAANLGRARWEDAAPLGPQAVLVAVAAFAAGAIGYLAARRGPDEPPAMPDVPQTDLGLDPGRSAVWVSSVSSPPLFAVGLVVLVAAGSLAVAALFGLPAPAGPMAAVTAVAGLAVLSVSTVAVTAGPEGLRIGFGPLRWPSRRVPLSRIERAWAERAFPSEVGGWGYRGLPGAATIMIRGGDCLVVRYTSGGQLRISVDDAANGAALLNALLSAPLR
ncbi:DUF1648 domain-containing protein [Microbispora sp. NPDC049125]|uniref:DUF1648 domain-containing protein n=1 Tax=Microbispora sp. NPDC049125 TaxID=3154929 RepID=UPI0034660A44